MEKEALKSAIAVAANKALGNGQDMHPSEETLSDKKSKIVMINAMARAIKYKLETPDLEDDEVVQRVVGEADGLIETVERSMN